MAQDDTLEWKLRLDTSDLQTAAQQAALQTQQISAGSLSQTPTYIQNQVMNTMIGAGRVSPLSPQAGIMQSMIGASINSATPGMRQYTPDLLSGGGDLMGNMYRGAMPSSFPYQFGFLPSYAPQHSHNLQGAVSSFMKFKMMEFGSSSMGQSMGLGGLGFENELRRLDLPYARTKQLRAEEQAESRQNLRFMAGSTALTGMQGLALGGAMVGGIPGFLAGAALNVPLGMARDAMEGSYQDYMSMGRYVREAAAPTMRGREFGGMSYDQMGRFNKGLSKMVADDKHFTRDDYANLVSTSFDAGLQQFSDTEGKMLKVIDKFKQNLRSLYTVGVKMNETLQYVDQMNALGVGAGEDPRRFARLMGMFSASAFSGGVTMNNMMPGVMQAGSSFAQLGIAPNIGGQVHATNVGQVGEGIRTGQYNQSDLAYYGGREGISGALTQGMAGISASPLGQATIMGMVRDPDFMGNVAKGEMTYTDLMKSLNNMDPKEYMNMKYKMPEYTKNLDPNAVGMGQVGLVVNTLKKDTGREKVNAGEVFQLLSRMVGPDSARLMVRQIEDAVSNKAAAEESLSDMEVRFRQEASRPALGLHTEEGFQNKVEEIIDPLMQTLVTSSFQNIHHDEEKFKDRLGGGGLTYIGMEKRDLNLSLYNTKNGINPTTDNENMGVSLKALEDEALLELATQSDKKATRVVGRQVIPGKEGDRTTVRVPVNPIIERKAIKEGGSYYQNIDIINATRDYLKNEQPLNIFAQQGIMEVDDETKKATLQKLKNMSASEAEKAKQKYIEQIQKSGDDNAYLLAAANFYTGNDVSRDDLLKLSESDPAQIRNMSGAFNMFIESGLGSRKTSDVLRKERDALNFNADPTGKMYSKAKEKLTTSQNEWRDALLAGTSRFSVLGWELGGVSISDDDPNAMEYITYEYNQRMGERLANRPDAEDNKLFGAKRSKYQEVQAHKDNLIQILENYGETDIDKNLSTKELAKLVQEISEKKKAELTPSTKTLEYVNELNKSLENRQGTTQEGRDETGAGVRLSNNLKDFVAAKNVTAAVGRYDSAERVSDFGSSLRKAGLSTNSVDAIENALHDTSEKRFTSAWDAIKDSSPQLSEWASAAKEFTSQEGLTEKQVKERLKIGAERMGYRGDMEAFSNEIYEEYKNKKFDMLNNQMLSGIEVMAGSQAKFTASTSSTLTGSGLLTSDQMKGLEESIDGLRKAYALTETLSNSIEGMPKELTKAINNSKVGSSGGALDEKSQENLNTMKETLIKIEEHLNPKSKSTEVSVEMKKARGDKVGVINQAFTELHETRKTPNHKYKDRNRDQGVMG